MNGNGFNWAYAFLCAGIAFSIADRPGIVPGFAIGMPVARLRLVSLALC